METENYIASVRTNGKGEVFETGEQAICLTGQTDPSSQFIRAEYGVRRYTPQECERLQGFSDDFTKFGIDKNGKEIQMSDSARYKMLGNAVTVNVAHFIGLGIPLE